MPFHDFLVRVQKRACYVYMCLLFTHAVINDHFGVKRK